MMFAAMLLIVLVSLLPLPAGGSATTKPIVVPLFSTVADGPAFLVDCLNDTGAPLSALARTWASALRLDGRVLDSQGVLGGGITSTVQAGGTWRGIVVLRPEDTGYLPAPKFGARLRITRVLPMEEGRHTFAVQCGNSWSNDVEFYWEGEKRRRD